MERKERKTFLKKGRYGPLGLDHLVSVEPGGEGGQGRQAERSLCKVRPLGNIKPFLVRGYSFQVVYLG